MGAAAAVTGLDGAALTAAVQPVLLHQRGVVEAAVDRAAASTGDGGAWITDAEAVDIQTATAAAIAAVTAAVQAEADALCTDTLTAAADQAQGQQKAELLARVVAANATDANATDALCRSAESAARAAVADTVAAIATMEFDTKEARSAYLAQCQAVQAAIDAAAAKQKAALEARRNRRGGGLITPESQAEAAEDAAEVGLNEVIPFDVASVSVIVTVSVIISPHHPSQFIDPRLLI